MCVLSHTVKTLHLFHRTKHCLVVTIILNKQTIRNKTKTVHRCGASGYMRACHAAGPGSIPGWDKFPG